MNITQLAERIDGVRAEVQSVGKDVTSIKEQALDRRLSAVEDGLTWLRRLLTGAVVTMVVLIAVALATAAR